MKRLLSVLMSVALVIGLCPGLAYAGDGLAAGGLAGDSASVSTQARKGFVADRVYALIGNKYAMMVTEKKGVQNIDIIDSNYESKLKMTRKEKPNKYGHYNIAPISKYQYAGLLAHGVEVYDKDTGKHGLISFEGKQMIPCSYYDLDENSSGNYVVGSAANKNGTATITVLSGKTGKRIVSANIGKADSFYAYWSYNRGKINVNRSYNDSSTYKHLSEVYSFNGKTLKRISSKKNSYSYEWAITPSIVQCDDGYYTAKGKSGKLIRSLLGWSYDGKLLNSDKYLFHFSDGESAKLVDGEANTLATFTAPKEQEDWGVVGDYVYSATSYDKNVAVHTVYSEEGKQMMELPKGQYLNALNTGSDVRYYSSKNVKVKTLGGARATTSRSVKFYDENLKVVKNAKPALGSYLQSVNEQNVYDSGRDAAGNRNGYSGYKQGSPDVVTSEGKAVKCGKYTLSRPVRGAYTPISRSDLQFNSKDAYVVKSSSGKYGFASSSGKVLVRVENQDVFCGTSGCRTLPQSNKAMVKKNGAWSFSSVA